VTTAKPPALKLLGYMEEVCGADMDMESTLIIATEEKRLAYFR
jgi:hypothetical protein